MEQTNTSKTAQRVAMRRAAHQVLDQPRIFDDPLALRVLGLDEAAVPDHLQGWLDDSPFSRVLRGSLAARSRYTEDELHAAVRRGVSQYVILGAGLDTFAYRNPYPQDVLHVFEVDRPATQQWKLSLLRTARIPIPESLWFVPVDFETQGIEKRLRQTGFDTSKAAFFSWLGVTMYLSKEAINTTLRLVASMPVGSSIVFDYLIAPELLSQAARKAFDSLAYRVAMAGEPFQSFFDPSSLALTLREMGFHHIEDIGPDAMDSRYFQGRTDGQRAGRLAHLLQARM